LKNDTRPRIYSPGFGARSGFGVSSPRREERGMANAA
jgi:hypothetical protein